MGQGVSIKMSAADKRKFANDIKKFSADAGKAVELSIEQVARQTTFEAKQIVPVDKGFLKGSIRAEKKERLTWEVATNIGYGLYVEFGTPVGTGPNGGPRPFLRPAFERAKQKIFTYLRQNFKK